MLRLATLIVMIFAFASVAGATTAHAHRYLSTPIVVLNLVDANNQSIPVTVTVQRGQIDLGSGIMLPCGPHQAIPLTVVQLPVRPHEAGALPHVKATAVHWPTIRLLRPPRQA